MHAEVGVLYYFKSKLQTIYLLFAMCFNKLSETFTYFLKFMPFYTVFSLADPWIFYYLTYMYFS